MEPKKNSITSKIDEESESIIDEESESIITDGTLSLPENTFLPELEPEAELAININDFADHMQDPQYISNIESTTEYKF